MCVDDCPADTTYPSMAHKYWPEFIRSKNLCSSLVKNPNFLTDAKKPRDDWCRAFIKWLADTHSITKHRAMLKKATSWLQGRIVFSCKCALVSPPHDGYVVSISYGAALLTLCVGEAACDQQHCARDSS